MKLSIHHERLSQAKRMHRFSLLMTTAFSSPVIISALLMAWGQAPPNVWEAAPGVLPIISCLQLVRESNDRLDKILAETETEEENA